MSKGKFPVCIMGIGGGGGNILDYLYARPSAKARYLALDTDAKALALRNNIPALQLAPLLAGGRDAKCSTLDVACSVWDRREDIENLLSETKLLLLVAGLGGSTGSAAAPFIAKMAQDLGVASVALATLPFTFEGKRRQMIAEESLGIITKVCHRTFVIQLNRVLPQKPDASFGATFSQVNASIYKAAQAVISDFENEDKALIL